MTGRGLAGRRLARAILFATLLIDGLVAMILLNPSGMMGPLPGEPAGLEVPLILAVGILVNVFGLAWMARIVGADPEHHRSWWRAAGGR